MGPPTRKFAPKASREYDTWVLGIPIRLEGGHCVGYNPARDFEASMMIVLHGRQCRHVCNQRCNGRRSEEKPDENMRVGIEETEMEERVPPWESRW